VLLAETKRRLQPLGVPLIASIFAGTVEEYGRSRRSLPKPSLT